MVHLANSCDDLWVIGKLNIMVDSRSFIEEDVGVILVVALGNPRLDLGIIEQVPCL